MSLKSTSSSSEYVPILKKGRSDIDQWERKFNDYAIGAKWKGIFDGTQQLPVQLTPAELQQIPAAQRYQAQRDRAKEITDFQDRSEAAFAGISKAMEEDQLIYASAALDALRNAVPRDPAAAYNLVMTLLRPTHVDAQMTAEYRIGNFALLKDETVPAAFQRLLSYSNCLEIHNRPDDLTMMRHMKRAIRMCPSASKSFLTKVESMMDRDPPINFATFCTGLLRKYEEIQSELTQEAALNTEVTQEALHGEGEQEQAFYSGGKGGKSSRGRGGKGRRQMGKGHMDARIGALYYGKGGYGADDDRTPDHFWRGAARRNGGRGYQFDHYSGGKGGGGRGSGGGKKRGGKGDKPLFDGYCHRCDRYGHREADCYANLKKSRK